MLTFEFTGVDGRMTESETLTSGMVGKTVQILFDESWNRLTKTVVFRCDGICRTADGSLSPVTIPEDVLARPFRKLHVGVFGTDEAGTLVIPTVMAEGPMIRYGANPTEDSTAEDLPMLQRFQAQIGNLADLETDAKENLVAAINEINSLGGSGLSETAAGLLIEILRHGVFETNQRANIDALESALFPVPEDSGSDSDIPEEPDEPEITLTGITVTYAGGDVPVGTAVADLTGLTVTAHLSDGSTKTVTSYTLAGIIAEGSNTLDVSYGGKSATFTVTGVAESGGEEPPQVTLSEIRVSYLGGDVPVGTSLENLTGITVTAFYSDGTDNLITGYSLSGTIAEGQNTVTVFYQGKTASFTVTGVAEATVQSETLEIVYASGYPNVTTFVWSEQASAGTYVMAKQGNLRGGSLSVDFDPTVINWNLNLYVFDAAGNPYCQTDKAFTSLSHPTYGNDLRWMGDMDNDYVPGKAFEWQAVGAGAGFGVVLEPFTIKIPDGCNFIACMRAGSSGKADFATWAKNGGITFTVTTTA